MTRLRIALAQVNSTVGDLAGNAATVAEWTRRAADAGADLVVFPEMMLTGYPVEDLALRDSFVDASIAALEATARELNEAGLGHIAVVTGYLAGGPARHPGPASPSARPRMRPRCCTAGRSRSPRPSTTCRTTGCSTNTATSCPGTGCRWSGSRYRGAARPLMPGDGEAVDVAIAICEDLWQDGGPVAVTRQAGAGLLVVPNASPYERGKDQARLELCVRRAREAGAALAYVNMMGGQDELVFDGDSIIVDAEGGLITRGPQCEEALLVADLDLPPARPVSGSAPLADTPAGTSDGTVMSIHRVALPRRSAAAAAPPPPLPDPPAIAARLAPRAEIYAALVTGVRDYVRKNGFRSVILGLSGGIDSALVATIAADALGPDAVHVVLMPSRYSSEHSVGDAEELAKRQGLHARTVPIAGMVDAFEAELDLQGLSAENLQSRIRGVILMGLSNAAGHLVLTTGNKSEIATGYSTLYGDSAGGFGPIKDVPKTLVWELARWRDAQAVERGETPPIPENSITKPPSAELAPGQLDTDSLPDYAVLDAILDDYVEKDMGAAELIAAGHDPGLVERIIQLVDRAEYKRRQYPPGPKITPRNFGRDRRLPITSRWREPVPKP